MTEVGISVSEIQKITGCHYQQGVELYNRILERDNDKLDQLEQMAKRLLGCIEGVATLLDGKTHFIEFDWHAIRGMREQLEALGVIIDD